MLKTPLKDTKKTEKCCNNEEIKKQLKKVSSDVMATISEVKKKFNKADPSTKKKIVTGLTAAAAGLLVLAGIKKHKKKD